MQIRCENICQIECQVKCKIESYSAKIYTRQNVRIYVRSNIRINDRQDAKQGMLERMSQNVRVYIYISDKMPGGMLEYMPDGLSYVRCQMPGDLPCETLETVTWDDDPR